MADIVAEQLRRAELEGNQASWAGMAEKQCPYPTGKLRIAWLAGWNKAQREQSAPPKAPRPVGVVKTKTRR
ncbi:MAG: ribosome modulation factor [Sandaracinus sp.]